MAFKLVSLNVRGLNSPQKQAALKKEAPYFVQGTHFALNKTQTFKLKHYDHRILASGPTKKNGVLIAIWDSPPFQIHQTHIDKQGRYIILVCDINQTTYTLVNVCAPNTKQIHCCKCLLKKVDTLSKCNIISGGNFNTVNDHNSDTSSDPWHYRPALKSLFHAYDLYDMWRCQHGSKRDLTYFSPFHLSYSRPTLV